MAKSEGEKKEARTAGGSLRLTSKKGEIEPPHLQLALFESGLISWTLFNKVNGKNDVPGVGLSTFEVNSRLRVAKQRLWPARM